MIQIPLEIGDTILAGRFKNKKITVKEISYDEYGSPTVNGRSILKIRIPKLYQKQENLQEMKKPIKFIGYKKDSSGNIFMYVESIAHDLGSEFKGSIIQYGYLNKFGSRDKSKGWIRFDSPRTMYEKQNFTWEEGTIKLEIKKEIKQENNMNLNESEPHKYYGMLFNLQYPDDVTNLRSVTAKDQYEALWKYAKRGFGYEKNNIKQLGNNTWAFREKSHIYIITTNGDVSANKIIPAIKAKYKITEYQKSNFTESKKLKEEVKPFQKSPIEVKIRKDDDRFHIFLQTIDGEQQLSIQGYETKEQAEHAAMMKGYKYDGNPYFEKHKGIEVPKATKSEPVKHEKAEELDLGKEKELKLENFIREVIRMELGKRKVRLKEEISEEEKEMKAREFLELAQTMKRLEAELKKVELRYTQLDQELTPLVEQVGKTKDTFIRAGKLLIKIERESYEKKNKSYKTGFEYLYSKVNALMKDLAEEALKMTETVSYVKSKISVVQGESNLKEENWFRKIKNFLGSKIKKLFGLNNQANQLLTQLESKI